MSTDRFRKPRTYFTQVSNHAIDDERISPQAYYIYSKIQRYITIETDTFILNKSFILWKSNMAEKTFDKYWKELQHLGYLKSYQIPDNENKGQWITEYELLEKADLTIPYFTQYNTKGEIVRIFECPLKDDSNTPKKTRKSVKSTVETLKTTVPPKKGGSVKASHGKMGGLNNTGGNNTGGNNINSSSSDEEDIISKYKDYMKISKISQEETELLFELIKEHGTEKVAMSIKQAVIYGGKSIKYVQSIVVNGINTKVAGSGSKGNSRFTDIPDRATDYNKLGEIENKIRNGDYLTLDEVEFMRNFT